MPKTYTSLEPVINLLRETRKKATSPMHDNILLNTQQLLELQANDPTVTIKIIKCKDCKFYTNNINDNNLRDSYCHRTKFAFNDVLPDDFCSKAVKLEHKLPAEKDERIDK